MKYHVDKDLDAFEAWCGGKAVLDMLKQHPEAYDYISATLDEMSEYSDLDETDINDFLWFEALEMLAEAGYYDDENGKFLCKAA